MANAVSGRRINNADREFCKPCLLARNRKGANNFCQQCACRLCDACVAKHKTSADTIDHEVSIGIFRAGMGEAAGRGSEVNGGGNETPGRSGPDNMCPFHANKEIEFFCGTHRRVFCYICSTVKHRSDECDVSYIPDIADQELRRINVASMIRKIDARLNDSTATQRQASRNLSAFQDALTEAMHQIESFRSEINRTLGSWESDLKETLNRKRQSSMTLSPSDLQHFSYLREQLEQLQTRILQRRNTQNLDRLFIQLIQADTLLEENEQEVANITDQGMNIVKFKRNPNITAMLRTETCLGEIVSISASTRSVDSGAGSFSGSLGSQRAIASKEISVKTRHDKRTCWITSMIVLSSSEQIIVADHSNRSVKLIDTVTSRLISLAELTSGPWEITQMPNNHFVATMFDEEALEFMCISENKLRSLKKVTTYGRCQGVAYSQAGLIVTFISPPKFHIYSIEGAHLVSSPEMPRLNNMLHITIARDGNHVIVGNDDSKSIVKMDFNGTIINEYRDGNINSPRGLACHDDGSIFVCSKKDHSVLRVSADMKQCSVVMKRAFDFCSIKNPYAVAYDSRSALLFLSCNSGKSKYDNAVKVFQMDDILRSSFNTSF